MTLNKQTHVELFSEELNSWIELNLHQFSDLLSPHWNCHVEDEEFDINASGLSYKLSSDRNYQDESLIIGEIKEGDFYEIQSEARLAVKICKWYNGDLKVDALDKDIADNIEDWQDMAGFRTVSGTFKIYTRCRVIEVNPNSNEVIVSSRDGDSIETVSLDKVRLLSEGFERDYPTTYYSQTNFSNTNTNAQFDTNSLKLKRICIKNLLTKIQKDDKEIDKSLLPTANHIMNFIKNLDCDLKNFFFDIDYESVFSIDNKLEPNYCQVFVISTHINLLYISHLLSLKIEKFIESQKLNKKIQKAKEKIESVNKIIETREKKNFKFSCKFSIAILKLLEDLNKEEFSFVTSKNGDFFEVIIYEKGESGCLKKVEKEFDFKEDFIRVDAKIAEWVSSKENKEELDKMMKISKIVKMFFIK